MEEEWATRVEESAHAAQMKTAKQDPALHCRSTAKAPPGRRDSASRQMESKDSPRPPAGVVWLHAPGRKCLFSKENFLLLPFFMVYGQFMFYQLWRMGGIKCH